MLVFNLRKYSVFFICGLCFVILAIFIAGGIANTGAVPNTKYTIVIDAGHGGIDGGVIGISGTTKESDVNLAYALTLAEYFKSMNINVVYTRTSKDGLYSAFSKNKKADDMKARQRIIEETRPDLLISIHQNGYTSENQRGITAFFNPKNEESKKLACIMQDRFKKNIEYARSEALEGDYFILNCTNYLGVLVECGFLTNKEDEILLNSDTYRQDVCYQIFVSVIKYFINNDVFIENLNNV